MGRKNLAKERRAEIARGLYQCIAKRGYANTSVRDIAAEANIALGIITHYFKSKDEILYAMTEDTYSRYWESFMRFSRKHQKKTPRERLRLSIEFIFLKVAGDRDLIKVFQELWSLSQHDEYLLESLRKLYRQYRALVADLLLEMLPEKERRDTTIKDVAAFLVGASEGAALLWFIEPRAISLKRSARIANQLVDSILGTRHLKSDGAAIKGGE